MAMEDFYIEAVRPRQHDTGPSKAADLPKRPRCAAIIAVDPAIRSAGIEAAAVAMANGSVASVRVGNPLASPLTLQRILFQMDLDGGEDDADADDEARLVRLLEKRRGAQDRIVLVVERAETLDPAALPQLQRIASAPGAVHILFVGGPAFWLLLEDAELAPLRRALTGQGTEPAAVALPIPVIAFPVAPVRLSASAIPDRPVDPMAGPRPAMSARSGRRWWIVGAVGAVAIVASSVAAVFAPGGLFYYAVPQRDMPPPPGEAADLVQPPVPLRLAPSTPPVTAPAPASPSWQVMTPVLPTTVQAGPLAPLASPALPPPARSEPTRSPNAPGDDPDALTDAQRDAQSEQSPSWRPRDAALLAPPSSLEGRVVIHYRSGSGSGEVEAARLAAVAAPLAAKVQTRMVADTPSAPVIRFFHPEDAERARHLADALGGSGPRWDVRDFSSFRPSPSPGTVEVWTPAR
jgi:hypothetical protein